MTIYQHFREEEHAFVDQVLEWIEDVKFRHKERLTDFLDPREQEIVRLIVGHDDDLSLSFSGGSSYAERKRAYLAPSYIVVSEDEYQLTLFSVEYPSKFVTLTHRDVLGALMSIGLKREKFGDVSVVDETIQIVVATGIADFVEMNLHTVGKATVRLNRILITEHIIPKEEWIEAQATISSMRLDAYLSGVYKLSRSKVLPYIDKGLVKVNWKVVTNGSFVLKAGDTISCRGFGRSFLFAIEGLTKKDRFRIRYGRNQ